jgi:hypothetical protein
VGNFIIPDEFNHKLISKYKAGILDVWEVAGHTYTIMEISLLKREVIFNINYLQHKSMSLDETAELFEQMKREEEKGKEWLDVR